MEESSEVRDAMFRFFDRLSASDVAAFYDCVELGPATLIVGTAPGERVTEEERLRFGFEAEGLVVEPGPSPTAWAEGTLGWYEDEPRVTLPDGTKVAWRMTTVLHRSDAGWRLVHMHASVGVPDEEVVELQERWGTTPD